MNEGRSQFARPTAWALGVIAVVGWLVALYFWSESVGLRADGEEALRRAEVARQGLVGELQELQQAVGSAAELRKKLEDGRKALDDAVAQRTSVQSDLAELTRRVDETELSLASETDQLDSKTAQLKDLDSKIALLKDTTLNLKATQDELADLAAQKAAVAADLDKARADLAVSQAKADAASKAADVAKARLDDLQAKIEAARKKTP